MAGGWVAARVPACPVSAELFVSRQRFLMLFYLKALSADDAVP